MTNNLYNYNAKGKITSDQNGVLIGTVDTMPAATPENYQSTVLYVGATAGAYTQYHFYRCVQTGGVLEWIDVTAGGSGGSVEWGSITGSIRNQGDLYARLELMVQTQGDQQIAGQKTFTDVVRINNRILFDNGTFLTGSQYKSLTETVNTLETTVAGKQDKLPNSSTVGYVLKATNTSGGVEWGPGGAGAATWGSITGTLSNQTDLQNALDAKADYSALALKADASALASEQSARQAKDTELEAAINGIKSDLNTEIADRQREITAAWTGINDEQSARVTKDTELENALANKQKRLVAGTNITITEGTDYDTISSADAAAVWGSITGSITSQTDLINQINTTVATETAARTAADTALQAAIDGKQHVLIAGTNITITPGADGDTISAAGGSGGIPVPSDCTASADDENRTMNVDFSPADPLPLLDMYGKCPNFKLSASGDLTFSGLTIPTIVNGEINPDPESGLHMSRRMEISGEHHSEVLTLTSKNLTMQNDDFQNNKFTSLVLKPADSISGSFNDFAGGDYTYEYSFAPTAGNEKLILKPELVEAGDNVTIDKTGVGIIISATGGGSDDAIVVPSGTTVTKDDANHKVTIANSANKATWSYENGQQKTVIGNGAIKIETVDVARAVGDTDIEGCAIDSALYDEGAGEERHITINGGSNLIENSFKDDFSFSKLAINIDGIKYWNAEGAAPAAEFKLDDIYDANNIMTEARIHAGTNITIEGIYDPDDPTTRIPGIKISSTGGTASWGHIGGVLQDQSDLNSALLAKQDKLPTASAAGKILKSTDNAGGTEWADLPVPSFGELTGDPTDNTNLANALSAKANNSLSNVTVAEANRNKIIKTGSDGKLVFTTLVAEDIPEIPENKVTNLASDLYAKQDKLTAGSGISISDGGIISCDIALKVDTTTYYDLGRPPTENDPGVENTFYLFNNVPLTGQVAEYLCEPKGTTPETYEWTYVGLASMSFIKDTVVQATSNLVENQAVYYALLEKQNLLPDAGVAGKMLVSTTTQGTVEWADIPSGVTDVTVDGTSVVSGGVAALTLSGYENKSNKLDVWQTTPDDNHYPSEKLTKDTIDALATTVGGKIDATALLTAWQSTPDNTHIPSEKLAYDTFSTLSDAISTKVGKAQIATAWETVLSDEMVPSEKLVKETIDAIDVSGKEDTSNKVSAWSETVTDDHYPSEKLVKDTIDAIDITGKEDTANKVTEWQETPDDTHYPSEKLTKDSLDAISTELSDHVTASNPHGITKSKIGLGDVDNTSDLSKPISNAVAAALGEKVDKIAGKGLSTNDYTDAEKSKLAGIAAGAEVNVLESVKVNGTALPIADKAVDVTVPTELADLADDATHRLVSDTEKTTWNGKQNALTFDNTPTVGSTNPVTSTGIYTAIAGKADPYTAGFGIGISGNVINATTNLKADTTYYELGRAPGLNDPGEIMTIYFVKNFPTPGSTGQYVCEPQDTDPVVYNWTCIGTTDVQIIIDAAPDTTSTNAIQNQAITNYVQNSLASKAEASVVSTHIANVSNPHQVTAAQVGLGNVENKALSSFLPPSVGAADTPTFTDATGKLTAGTQLHAGAYKDMGSVAADNTGLVTGGQIYSYAQDLCYAIKGTVTVNATNWYVDTEDPDYGITNTVELTGIKDTDIVTVVYEPTQALGGNYAPYNKSVSNGIKLYAKVAPTANFTINYVAVRKVSEA